MTGLICPSQQCLYNARARCSNEKFTYYRTIEDKTKTCTCLTNPRCLVEMQGFLLRGFGVFAAQAAPPESPNPTNAAVSPFPTFPSSA